MTTAALPDYLTAEDIAARWQIDRTTAARWMRAGVFGPLYGHGGVRRVAREEYEAGCRRLRIGGQQPQTRIAALPVLERQRGRMKEA